MQKAWTTYVIITGRTRLAGTQSEAGNKKCSRPEHIKQKKGDEKKNTLIFRAVTFYIPEG
jgi:hypothetical protein